jgi:L-iditol 2-dehydrogenase
MQCRTIRYLPKGGVEIIEAAVTDPKPYEVQIRALACGVCAWDVHVFKKGVDWPTGPGHEGVGQVIAVGEHVGNLKIGDWVTGVGMGFTEICNMNAHGLYVIPHSGDDEPQDWVVEPVSCVITGVDHCALKAGDRVAVVGCGFMGLMMVQALSRSLCGRLVAIDVDPQRLLMAREFGATDVIDARSVDVGALQAMSLDTVVDCSGAQAGLDLSSKIIRNGGRLNLFGWNHGTGSFPGDLWHMNGLTVVNSAPNSALRDPWPAAIRLLERHFIRLRPLVSHVVTLDEYPALLAKAAARQDGYTKGVVKLADPQ